MGTIRPSGHHISRTFTLGHMNKGWVLCKKSKIVYLRGVGGQDWVKMGPRNCWMTPYESCSLEKMGVASGPAIKVAYLGAHV